MKPGIQKNNKSITLFTNIFFDAIPIKGLVNIKLTLNQKNKTNNEL